MTKKGPVWNYLNPGVVLSMPSGNHVIISHMHSIIFSWQPTNSSKNGMRMRSPLYGTSGQSVVTVLFIRYDATGIVPSRLCWYIREDSLFIESTCCRIARVYT